MKLTDSIDRIKEIANLLPDDDPDKQELLDIEGDYSNLINWALLKRTEFLEMAAANKELLETYKNRQKSFENRADKMKSIIETIMNSANETKFISPYATVSFRDIKPKPIIVDEDKIPNEYKKLIIDKTKINKAINNNIEIDGVSIDNGGKSLTIRVK